MSTKKTNEEEEKPKPKEILKLEELVTYGNGHGSISYAMDVDDRIISLSLYECKPVDFKFLHQQFPQLDILSFINSNLSHVSGIELFENLTRLSLWGNKINSIHGIGQLKNLTFLDLWDNHIEDISPLNSLKQLEHLDIEDNPIHSLTPIEGLINLRRLSLGKLNLYEVSFLRHFDKLEVLTIDDNHVADVSALLSLKALKSVSCRNNKIKRIDVKWMHLEVTAGNGNEFDINIFQDVNPEAIILTGNPLVSPPTSVIQLGKSSLHEYFDSQDKFGSSPISEARILLLGDGSAGKSSLRNRIIYNSFDENENQTNGIKIDEWHLPHTDGRDLKFNIWDFGGQEVQHAVHKFFLSSGCLYLLVLDNRKEEEPEYWLQHIESFGGNSPVIILFNKQDQNNAERVDRKFLKDKYPNIVGFYNISCKTGAGLTEFMATLKEEAVKLNTIDEELPANWLAVKKELEKATTNSSHYLVYDAYTELCKRNNVTEEKVQKLLLEYLSTIGTITWFGDTFLEHMHILNPAWITQGVYRIVTGNKTNVLKGHIKVSDFEELLYPLSEQDYKYHKKHYAYIIALMRKFELCYYNESTEELLIPSAFGKEPRIDYSEFKGDEVRLYVLQFKDYLPVSVVHQFISRNIEKAYDHNYWYQGIVLQDNAPNSDALAMVQYDKEAKQILIRIKGESKLGLWERIRGEFRTITQRYAKIIYSEQIAIDNNLDLAVEYVDLINHLKAGRKMYFHSKQIREYRVADLIGWFEPKESTVQKFETGDFALDEFSEHRGNRQNVTVIKNILYNENKIDNRVNVAVKIDVSIVQQASTLKEEANYLLGEVGEENKELREALTKALQLAEDIKSSHNKEELAEKGWRRRLGGMLKAIENGGVFLKNIADGGEAAGKIIQVLKTVYEYLQVNPPGSL
jgi:small GTP-binding protein